jgi:hypothetical protein
LRTETNRYGEPIEQVNLESVIGDLLEMPADLVYAICASLIIAHGSYSWGTDREIIIKKLSEGKLG